MIKKLFQTPSIDWINRYERKLSEATHPLLKAFYAAPLATAETPIDEIRFVAMDFETTGLNAKKDGIITIGLVPFTLKRIYMKDARHWIVRPRQALDEQSVVIHNITHSDIINAPDLSKVIEPVLNALAGSIIVVHYRKIEREFLDRALKEIINEGICFPVIDTLQLELQIQQRLCGGLWNQFKGRKPESVRLGQARKRYGLPTYTPHHALTDAIATAELLQAQIAYYYDPKQPVRDFWL